MQRARASSLRGGGGCQPRRASSATASFCASLRNASCSRPPHCHGAVAQLKIAIDVKFSSDYARRKVCAVPWEALLLGGIQAAWQSPLHPHLCHGMG